MKFLTWLLVLAGLCLPRVALGVDDAEWERVVEARSDRDARKKELAELKAALAELAKSVNGAIEKATAAKKDLGAVTEEAAKAAAQAGVEALAALPGALPVAPDEKKPIDDALTQLETAIKAAREKLVSVAAAKTADDKLAAALATAAAARAKLATFGTVAEANTALTEAEAEYQKSRADYALASKPSKTLSGRLWSSRRLRCMTAYCFGGDDGTKYAVEPVLDLPFGVVWSASGGALRSYVNSHTLNIEFNAGLRYWFAYDTASLMVYISRPVIESTDRLHVPGSSFQHAPAAIRRPYPSVGVGLFGDVLLLGLSFDELRNGTTPETRDPKYPAGEVLSRSLTFSLGFSIVNTARNVADTARSSSSEAGAR